MQKEENVTAVTVVTAQELGYVQEPLENELNANLKTTLFGGYTKKSVSAYVERLKDTIEQMHANMEQQVNALVREKTELVQETALLRQQLQDTEMIFRKNQDQVYQLEEECGQLKADVERNARLDQEKEQLFIELELEKSKLEAQLADYQNAVPEESRNALDFQKGKYRELEAENMILEREKEMLRTQVYEATLRQKESERKKNQNGILSQKISDLELEKNGIYQQSKELQIQLRRLEQERRASDTILEKYQRQETEYILLKQNNESYLEEISNLEESIHFMFEQMNQQSDAFKNLNECYEESDQKIQQLLREKTDMQLRNVELIEQLNQQADKMAEEAEASYSPLGGKRGFRQEEDSSRRELIELGDSGCRPGSDDKTVSIGDIKKRAVEITGELKERMNKQIGGV